MRGTCKRKRAWMDQGGLCVWNGEWGPVYTRREYDGEETDDINERRYNVLLDIYAAVRTRFVLSFRGEQHLLTSSRDALHEDL